MSDPQVDIDTIREITDMFIEAGIHMDAVNVEGLTAAQICTSRKNQVLFFSIAMRSSQSANGISNFFGFFPNFPPHFSIHPSVVATIRI